MNGLSPCPDVGSEQKQDALSGHVRASSSCIEGETNIWTVKQRAQMEAGFRAHLSHVLTVQGLSQQCLHLMNLQSHRGWIYLSTVKLEGDC